MAKKAQKKTEIHYKNFVIILNKGFFTLKRNKTYNSIEKVDPVLETIGYSIPLELLIEKIVLFDVEQVLEKEEIVSLNTFASKLSTAMKTLNDALILNGVIEMTPSEKTNSAESPKEEENEIDE